MPLISIRHDAKLRHVRRFALAWLPGWCLLVAVVSWYRLDAPGAAMLLTAAALASMICGTVRPRWMRGLYLAWMAVGDAVGWLLAFTLLAAIYYLLITPMALVMRLAGRDPLARRWQRGAATYWTPRRQSTDSARYFRQF